jgi:4'-phosphopantetheinyl transferase
VNAEITAVTPVGVLLAGSAEVPEGDAWLDPDERERSDRFRFEHRRADFRLGRWTAKRAVAEWLGEPVDLSRVAFQPDAAGAPVARIDGEPAPVSVSFSHRAGRAACAVAPADVRLGCDLEWIEPRSEAFVRDFFTPSEVDLVLSAPPEDHPLLANLIWSAKESVLKALRVGLREDTRSVEVRLTKREEGWSRLEIYRPVSGETFHGWWRREGGWVLTLAADPAPEVPKGLSGSLTCQRKPAPPT